MKYFPVGLNLQEQSCLVVGAGSIAWRKTQALMSAGAKITVIAPRAITEFESVLKGGDITWLQKQFEADGPEAKQDFLEDFALVVAATDSAQANRVVSDLCKGCRVPVNVASDVQQGTALLPAVINRDGVTIAIHSDGQSPTITRYLKRQLEAFVPSKIGILSRWAEQKRAEVRNAVRGKVRRQGFWQHILSGPVRDQVLAGRIEEAEQSFSSQLDLAAQDKLPGQVFLVGAGPGDPELLTIKALKLIQQADVVLYDRLVSGAVMALVPPGVERIYVGKRRSDHAVPQPEINQQLVDLARQGLRVLRLKGGDPFIFGRGGEELELLAESNVPFQVVPGITAASGCSSYAGIPLTHRDHAQSVRFVAGHLKDKYQHQDWKALAASGQTLVFYMGLSELPNICSQLLAHGADRELPAAIVEKGTLDEQRVAVGNLDSLPRLAVEQQFRAPTLVIVGSVVSLQGKLDWLNR